MRSQAALLPVTVRRQATPVAPCQLSPYLHNSAPLAGLLSNWKPEHAVQVDVYGTNSRKERVG